MNKQFLIGIALTVVLGAAQFAAAHLCYGGGYGGHCGGYGGYGGYGGGYAGYGGGYGGYCGGYGYSGYSGYLAAPAPCYDSYCPAPTQQNYTAPTSYAPSNGQYGSNYTYNAPPRQYYTLWQYDSSRACYSCLYQYLPTATSTAYNCHEVIYSAGDPYNYYYFNPYKRKFWGLCSVHQVPGEPRYSRLTPEDSREYVQQIPQSAFPTPGAMPAIPESADGVAMTLPQGGARLTPQMLASVPGNWKATRQDPTTGRSVQLDMTIKSDGNAIMTQTSEGSLPAPMYCRYNFDDTTIKMTGVDYGEYSFQVVSVGKDQLSLRLNGRDWVFYRV